MKGRKQMDTMTHVLEKLRYRAEDNEFFFHEKGFLELRGKIYPQTEARIIKTYRFEGESDPGDAAIIYVIRTNDGVVGYCIDAYGIYSSHTDDLYTDFIHGAQAIDYAQVN